MQFTCPFCRRKPTVKTFARYNRRAAVLGGLQDAMGDRRFLYAWCIDCGSAKQAYERTACTEERVPPIEGFKCEDCRRPRKGRIVVCPNVDCGYAIEKVAWFCHKLLSAFTHLQYLFSRLTVATILLACAELTCVMHAGKNFPRRRYIRI